MKKDRISILYEDKELLIVDKKAGLLCVSTEKEKEKTLFHKVYLYIKQKNKHQKIFIVNRLDRDTSGIVVFAKDEKTKFDLQNHWEEYAKVREYTAMVEGSMQKKKGRKISFLKENSVYKTYSAKSGKKAITDYEVWMENKDYSLLKIHILTGRKNQIRVHMQELGVPIVGDLKYGSKTNPLNRLGLHANYLKLYHPKKKIWLEIFSSIPKEFFYKFTIEKNMD